MRSLYISLVVVIFSWLVGNAFSSMAQEHQLLTPIETENVAFSPMNDTLLVIEDVNPEMPLDNRKPLLLVHGWNFEGNPASPSGSYWNNLLNYIKNDEELNRSYKPYLVKYWSNVVPISELAVELRKKVEAIGLQDKKIVLIGHSMGGLVSRSYIIEQQFTTGIAAGKKCGEMVDLIITLSSPHHGSPMANGPARDAKVKTLYKFLIPILDTFVFNATAFNQQNRVDLHYIRQ
jgi:triacylglycerol esterase/lipase EstA (alpha/beta hydrolase family)